MFKEIKDMKYWDNRLSATVDGNFYQSSNNAFICEFDDKKTICIEYRGMNCIILGMLVFCKEWISIPFGPIVIGKKNEMDLLNFIENIKKEFDLPVKFYILSDDTLNYKWIQKNLESEWNYTTALLNLDNSIENIMSGFNQNRRRILRKSNLSLKESIISDNDRYLDDFYKMYCDRLAITNGVVDVSLEQLYHMLKNKNVTLHTCLYENKPIAGIVSFRFNDTLINRYNCTDSEYLSLNPNSYLDFSLIKEGSQQSNLKFYDFSGIAEGENLDQKEENINRYKFSYGPKVLKRYRRYKL